MQSMHTQSQRWGRVSAMWTIYVSAFLRSVRACRSRSKVITYMVMVSGDWVSTTASYMLMCTRNRILVVGWPIAVRIHYYNLWNNSKHTHICETVKRDLCFGLCGFVVVVVVVFYCWFKCGHHPFGVCRQRESVCVRRMCCVWFRHNFRWDTNRLSKQRLIPFDPRRLCNLWPSVDRQHNCVFIRREEKNISKMV